MVRCDVQGRTYFCSYSVRACSNTWCIRALNINLQKTVPSSLQHLRDTVLFKKRWRTKAAVNCYEEISGGHFGFVQVNVSTSSLRRLTRLFLIALTRGRVFNLLSKHSSDDGLQFLVCSAEEMAASASSAVARRVLAAASHGGHEGGGALFLSFLTL